MAQAYIVEAVRTAGGRRNGALAGWHPADMAAETLNALVDRTGLDPSAIDDVILGCVTQGGEQAFAFARNAVLASKLPQSVPAVTIDRQCGSSQQAVQFAAQAVMSGHAGHRDRGGGGEHEPGADGLQRRAVSKSGRGRRAVQRAHQTTLWRVVVQPVRGRRDDGAQIRVRPRDARPLRA